MKRFFAFLFSIIFLLCFTTGCHKDIQYSKIKFSTGEFNGVFNPLFAESEGDRAVCDLVFDSPVELSESGDVISGVADFEVLENGNKYRFKLKNVKFSDGTKIKANDILFTLKVLADKSYKGRYDLSESGILGFNDYKQGKTTEIKGFEISEDGGFNIVLEKQNPKLLSMFTFGILSEEYYGEKYVKGDVKSLYLLNDKPFGSGQYIFESFENNVIKMRANHKYYKGNPRANEILLSFIGDDEQLSKFNMLETQYYANIHSKLPDHHNFKVKNYVCNMFYNLGFNCKDTLFSDKDIRTAVSMVINQENISEKICNSHDGVPTVFADVYKVERSEEKALTILKSKGYEKNADGFFAKASKVLEFSISYEKGSVIDEVIAKQIKEDVEKFGIKVELKETEGLDGKILAGKEQSFIICVEDGGKYFGASSFKSKMVENIYNFSDSEFDSLLVDYTKNSLSDGMKKIISEKVPCLPVYMKLQTVICSKDMSKIYSSAHRSIYKNLYSLKFQD